MGHSEHLILNMSGVYPDMGLDKSLNGAEIIDLSALEGINCYCGADSASAIRRALYDRPASAVHWIDSGDYHYLSSFWLEKVDRPFALLLIDHHPDMQEPAFEAMSCGGWARDAFVSLDNLCQVLMVGVNPDLELEMIDLMFDGVFAVTEDDICHGSDDLPDDVLEMISLLNPGIPVYVSIDKDALSVEYARTDWDQGRMTLGQLKNVIARVASGHEIIGVDVCGELTRSKGADDADLALNLKTDLEIADFLKTL